LKSKMGQARASQPIHRFPLGTIERSGPWAGKSGPTTFEISGKISRVYSLLPDNKERNYGNDSTLFC
jgi:hypothetical protein